MIRIGLATSIKVVGHFNCIEAQVINKLAAGTKVEGHKGCIKVDKLAISTKVEAINLVTSTKIAIEIEATDYLVKMERNVTLVVEMQADCYSTQNFVAVVIPPTIAGWLLHRKTQSVPHSLIPQVQMDFHVEGSLQISSIA